MKSKISSIRESFRRYAKDVEDALNFVEWLQSQSLDLGPPSITWKNPSYRIIYGNFDPLSIAGSLAAGGRFNIGGSQMSHFFPDLHMEACLYAASSVECAKKEAANPLGRARFFALYPNHALHLWDLRHLIDFSIHYPNLKSHVDASPLAAIWNYQKVPKISQILGSFLRKRGGDGLIYPSTKDENGKIMAIFVHDDNHARQLFTAAEVVKE